MAALLAIASATTFSLADFLGGLASRRTPVVVVTLLSQVAGLAVLAVVLPLHGTSASVQALYWGALAGVAGAGGLLAYLRALAIGPMGVTAPVAAVLGALVPIGLGLATGERPGGLALAGVAIGVVAVAVASRPAGRADEDPVARSNLHTGLAAALVAGLAFGLFFVALDAAPDDGGLWPLLGARIAGISMLVTLVARGRPGAPTARGVAIGLVSGLLDMVANVLFLLATQTGMLVLVAVLTSLYPVGIVLLARAVLRERLEGIQWMGVGLAVAATVLVTL